MSSIKQVIVLRNDLNMRKGKMCSQAAHASMATLLNLGGIHSSIDTKEDYLLIPIVSEALEKWIEGAFTKITLQCSSEAELLSLYEKAKGANLLCSLIQDNGLTEFKGVKTYTAIAIGPDYSEKIDVITGGLKLL